MPDKRTNRQRIRRCCFTINNIENEYTALSLIDLYIGSGIAKFLIFQEEQGDLTGHNHYQGYIEFNGSHDFHKIVGLLPPGAHVEAAKGSKAHNVDYCSKLHGRISGPYVYGDIASNQGNRTDLLRAVQMLDQTSSVQECVSDDSFAATYVKYSSGIEKLARLKRKPVFQLHPGYEKKDVICYWGPTGTGKTRTAYSNLQTKYPEEQPFICPDLSGQWFDGYQGQSGVIFDDFRGQDSGMKVDRFLRITDGYPLQVPVKGSFVPWAPRTIYFTSNVDPDEWYNQSDADTQAAVSRRISEKTRIDHQPQLQ